MTVKNNNLQGLDVEPGLVTVTSNLMFHIWPISTPYLYALVLTKILFDQVGPYRIS